MTWHTLTQCGALQILLDDASQFHVATVLSGTLLNLLNPKLSIFFLAVLPQFVVSGEVNVTEHILALNLVFMVMTFVVFALYGVFAAVMRCHVLGWPTVLCWLRFCIFCGLRAAGGDAPIAQRRLRQAGSRAGIVLVGEGHANAAHPFDAIEIWQPAKVE